MAELKPEQVTILIDSREQNPFDLSPMKMEETTLQTGDYSIRGLEDYVRVERKELNDLVKCFVDKKGERQRFKRMLERMKAFPKRLVVVEASWADLVHGNYRSHFLPKSSTGTIESWSGFFQVGFMFCGRRQHAQEFVAGYLYKIAKSFAAKAREFEEE